MGIIFYYINRKKEKKIKYLEDAKKSWDEVNNQRLELKKEKFNDFKKMTNAFYHSFCGMQSSGFSETIDKINNLTDNKFKSKLNLLKQGFIINVESQLNSFLYEIKDIPYPDNEKQFNTFRLRFSTLINQYEVYIKNIEKALGLVNLQNPGIQYLMYHLKNIGNTKKEELRKFY